MGWLLAGEHIPDRLNRLARAGFVDWNGIDPLCAFRRIDRQIPEENFGTGDEIPFRSKGLYPLGMSAVTRWLNAETDGDWRQGNRI
jgi:hypothetical protein